MVDNFDRYIGNYSIIASDTREGFGLSTLTDGAMRTENYSEQLNEVATVPVNVVERYIKHLTYTDPEAYCEMTAETLRTNAIAWFLIDDAWTAEIADL